jgi:hypothetical protein
VCGVKWIKSSFSLADGTIPRKLDVTPSHVPPNRRDLARSCACPPISPMNPGVNPCRIVTQDSGSQCLSIRKLMLVNPLSRIHRHRRLQNHHFCNSFAITLPDPLRRTLPDPSRRLASVSVLLSLRSAEGRHSIPTTYL